MSFYKIGCILLSLCVVACATEPAPLELRESYAKPKLDARDVELLKPCDTLPKIVDNPTPLQVLQQHAKEVIYYSECSGKQEKLAKLIRKIFDVRE